ncbi:MAG: MFS transporter [bacterium]|jgi:GPH family glycoside/pentoside/hexuronide:cation symporter
MSYEEVRISVKEKIGYGLGDMAANFVFQTLLAFQLNFYTDTFGLSAAAAGTMILVVGLLSGFFDPLMGIIADRTNTRWGRFRPWVLVTAVPFGIIAVLAFMTPNFSPQGKLIYAYITFTLLMAIYSLNNVPYSALSGVITGDVRERTSLSSYRQVFANASGFIIQVLALPMVLYFGQGDNAKGYQMTMGLFAILAVIFFTVTFFTTKERIQPDPNQKSSLSQDIKDLFRNGPWIVLFFVTVLIFVGLSMRSSTMLYYFKYCAGNETLFSLFNMVGLGSLIVGVMCSPALVKRYGSRDLFIGALAICAVFAGALILVPATATVIVISLEAARQFAWGITAPLLWAMMADVADFSEWKTGRRATAMVFAGTVFGLKAGLAIGRSFASWILDLFGYVPNAAQTAESMLGIKLIPSVFTAIVFFLGVGFLFLYKIDAKTTAQMAQELAERRKKYA